MAARNMDAAYPSRYITSADVTGKRLTATIKSVDYCKMSDGQEKPVAFFERWKKGVVLNKSKCKVLASLAHSNQFDDWVGLSIEIYGSTTDLRGEEVPCIKFGKTRNQKVAEVREVLNDDLPDALKGDGDDEPEDDEDL